MRVTKQLQIIFVITQLTVIANGVICNRPISRQWPFYNYIPLSLVNVQTNYCNNNLLILDVKQLNKIIKLITFIL